MSSLKLILSTFSSVDATRAGRSLHGMILFIHSQRYALSCICCLLSSFPTVYCPNPGGCQPTPGVGPRKTKRIFKQTRYWLGYWRPHHPRGPVL
ncbi:unnamed protein product [Ectocarpus sp. 12 AP-2014]